MSFPRLFRLALCIASDKDHALTDISYYIDDFHTVEHAQKFESAKAHYLGCTKEEKGEIIQALKVKRETILKTIISLNLPQLNYKQSQKMIAEVEKEIALKNFFRHVKVEFDEDDRAIGAITRLADLEYELKYPVTTALANTKYRTSPLQSCSDTPLVDNYLGDEVDDESLLLLLSENKKLK